MAQLDFEIQYVRDAQCLSSRWRDPPVFDNALIAEMMDHRPCNSCVIDGPIVANTGKAPETGVRRQPFGDFSKAELTEDPTRGNVSKGPLSVLASLAARLEADLDNIEDEHEVMRNLSWTSVVIECKRLAKTPHQELHR